VVSDAAKWNASGCGGADYARCNGVPVVVFPKSKSAPEGVSTDQLLNVLRLVLLIAHLMAGICHSVVYT
jgi:phosphoribosylglycinamide formyltransferase